MNSIHNKYSTIYFNLIDKRRKTPFIGSYSEQHHVIPKSLGGTDTDDNIVVLSAREHFICHLLLVKMFHRGSYEYFKMINAFGLMLWASGPNHKRYTVNNRSYGRLREEFSKSMKKSQLGHKNSQYGTMWICNVVEKKNAKISKNTHIPVGWIAGRNKWNIDIQKQKARANQTNFNRRHGILELGSKDLSEKLSKAAKIRTKRNPTTISRGTIWITNGDTTKRIPKDNLIPEGYRIGRK